MNKKIVLLATLLAVAGSNIQASKPLSDAHVLFAGTAGVMAGKSTSNVLRDSSTTTRRLAGLCVGGATALTVAAIPRDKVAGVVGTAVAASYLGSFVHGCLFPNETRCFFNVVQTQSDTRRFATSWALCLGLGIPLTLKTNSFWKTAAGLVAISSAVSFHNANKPAGQPPISADEQWFNDSQAGFSQPNWNFNNQTQGGNQNMTRQDALKILGLSGNPSDQQIKKAYYQKAMQYHPDKRPVAEKEQAEQDMAKISNAYAVLTGK